MVSVKSFLRPAPLVAIAWSIFQIYAVLIGFLHPLILYPIHVTFATALVFLNFPLSKNGKSSMVVDYFLAAFTFVIGIYLILNFPRFSTRIPFVDSATPADIFLGVVLVVMLLEVCRRTVGWSLTIIAILFIVYGFAGRQMPGLLAHRGLSLERFIDLQVLSPNGIFGLPIGVSAELVFYFVLFGAFLERSGGGELFSDLAYSLTGRVRGGAAKASLVSSALYGTISGSAVANVVVDGMITIPLMKRSGFQPHFAAAVEAVASTGGQIMPPVMGAAAFILAQIVGVSYWQVAIAAAIPACLYYVALFFAIDFESAKRGLVGLTKAELPDVTTGLKLRIHLIIPLALLVYYIISGEVTPVTAVLRSLAAVMIISFLRRATWMTPARILNALEKGAKESVSVAVPCAVAGMIIGVIINSGLGLKFTDIMIFLSGGYLMFTLILVMIAVIILGMGMPTSAAYLMAAILMAPALINLGVPTLAAHMFIFYFAVISMITPPVALASYAAASIGEADLWKTGIAGMKIAVPGFLIPFIFVYDGGLLLQGSLTNIVWRTFVSILGVAGLAGALTAYYGKPTGLIVRILLFIGSLMLILPETTTDFIGLAMLIGIYGWQKYRKSAEASQVAVQ